MTCGSSNTFSIRIASMLLDLSVDLGLGAGLFEIYAFNERCPRRATALAPGYRDGTPDDESRTRGIRSSRLGESGRHLGHEPRHFVLYLRMWLQPDIEIEDDLVEPDSLDFFQYLSNLLWTAE